MKKILFIMMIALGGMMTGVNANENVNVDYNINNSTIVKEAGQWTATYYGNTYKTARRTANGDAFNMHAMTCAAPKKYAFGTKLKVTNKENGKSVIVKVTDRGGFDNRTVDLTYGAFGRIASHCAGRIKVDVEVVR
jgi:rare lipoprotein A